MLVRAGGITNPGRIYRIMFCPTCESLRFHTIDFIEAERSEQGIFAWFRRRCTGVSPINDLHPRMQRLSRLCGREIFDSLRLKQWQAFVADVYY